MAVTSCLCVTSCRLSCRWSKGSNNSKNRMLPLPNLRDSCSSVQTQVQALDPGPWTWRSRPGSRGLSNDILPFPPQMTSLSQLQQVTRKMWLLLKRRPQSSPPSCPSRIPSTYDFSMTPALKFLQCWKLNEVSLRPLWRPEPAWLPGEENRAIMFLRRAHLPHSLQVLVPSFCLLAFLYSVRDSLQELKIRETLTWTCPRPAFLPDLLLAVPGSATLHPVPSVRGP